VIKEGLNLLFWVLIIRALLSWVSQGYNPIEAVFHQLTEPMLRPIRKVIPPLGGLDLSILVLIIGLQFLQILLMDFIG
jgi:YggT family protein